MLGEIAPSHEFPRDSIQQFSAKDAKKISQVKKLERMPGKQRGGKTPTKERGVWEEIPRVLKACPRRYLLFDPKIKRGL